MKRDILTVIRSTYGRGEISKCCPGHDVFPADTYRNRRSKAARSRDIKIEHRLARHIMNANIRDENGDWVEQD
jgi:hypothetical protein